MTGRATPAPYGEERHSLGTTQISIIANDDFEDVAIFIMSLVTATCDCVYKYVRFDFMWFFFFFLKKKT